MLQLFPQKGDIELYIIILGIGLIAPDLLQQLLFRQHLFVVQHQHFHQVIFLAA